MGSALRGCSGVFEVEFTFCTPWNKSVALIMGYKNRPVLTCFINTDIFCRHRRRMYYVMWSEEKSLASVCMNLDLCIYNLVKLTDKWMSNNFWGTWRSSDTLTNFLWDFSRCLEHHVLLPPRKQRDQVERFSSPEGWSWDHDPVGPNVGFTRTRIYLGHSAFLFLTSSPTDPLDC